MFQSVIFSFQNLTVCNTALKIAGGDSVYKQLKLAAHAVQKQAIEAASIVACLFQLRNMTQFWSATSIFLLQ